MRTIPETEDNVGLIDVLTYEGSAARQVVNTMRAAIWNQTKVSVPAELVAAATQEFSALRNFSDGTSPYFRQGVVDMVHGMDSLCDILCVKGLGILESGERLPMIIASDITDQIFEYYKGAEGYPSIDARMITDAVLGELRHRDLKHLTGFEVEIGTLHTFPKDQLYQHFAANGELDLYEVVRFFLDTTGHAGVKKTFKPGNIKPSAELAAFSQPSFEEYMARFVPFTSQRQKQSLGPKIKREICDKNPYTGVKDEITDQDAHRLSRKGLQEIKNWYRRLAERDHIGNFTVKVIHADDYVTNPKVSEYQAYNIALSTRYTKGLVSVPESNRVDFVREVQAYDARNHFISQIDSTHRAYHPTYRKKQDESRKHYRDMSKEWGYEKIIDDICGKSKLFIDLKGGHILLI